MGEDWKATFFFLESVFHPYARSWALSLVGFHRLCRMLSWFAFTRRLWSLIGLPVKRLEPVGGLSSQVWQSAGPTDLESGPWRALCGTSFRNTAASLRL